MRDLLGRDWAAPVAEIKAFNSSVYHSISADHGRLFIGEGDEVGEAFTNHMVKFFDDWHGTAVHLRTELEGSNLVSDPSGDLIGFTTNQTTEIVVEEPRSGQINSDLTGGVAALAPGLKYTLVLGAIGFDERTRWPISRRGSFALFAGRPWRSLVAFEIDGQGADCVQPTFDLEPGFSGATLMAQILRKFEGAWRSVV